MNGEGLLDAFFVAAERRPDATALIHRGERVTYRRLADDVRRLSSAIGASLEPGEMLAFMSVRSPSAITTMLACLVAGVPYVPVDPSAPAARREMILHDSGARVLVVDDRSPIPNVTVDVVRVGDLSAAGEAATPELRRPDGDDVAFVLYTSGSTGTPKGVLTTHRNAATFLRWAHELVPVGPDDVVACYAPLHFDMHVFDVLGTLNAGATVLLVDEKNLAFPEAVLAELVQEGPTVMYAVPTAWVGLAGTAGMRAHGMPSLRTLMYSGEEYPVARLRQLLELVSPERVVNVYGPVETNAVTALVLGEEHLAMDRIPIGLPFGGSRVILVDDGGAVVEGEDIEGEITVATPTLSPGYLNDPELTARSRMVVDLDGAPIEVYRTGDFGLWRDGLLHFRGRRDGRVKTRGFRVELGEVEARLLAHPAVRTAVVVARPHQDWTHELVGWVVLRGDASDAAARDLARWCREILPPYMVPRVIEVLATVPRTSTGKIDRDGLRRRAVEMAR